MSKDKKAGLRICSFGRTFDEADVLRVPFNSHRSLHDFDLVIFELHGLQAEWDEQNFHAIRSNQIEEFLHLGRTVVVLLSDFEGLSTLFPVDTSLQYAL
jgi:hypothetical protein